MRARVWLAPLALMFGLVAGCASSPSTGHGEVWDPATLGESQLRAAAAQGVDTIVLALDDRAPGDVDRAAAAAVRSSNLRLGYWLAVGRSPTLAATHPEWLASLQGHAEWRRLFVDAPMPAEGRVVQVWPWLPVSYAEAHAAHLERVRAQLAAMPAADVVFLNQLQGPPSACGCGNVLCRWATDYTLGGRKPIRSATWLGDAAAADFVTAVRGLAPGTEIVPIWVTECEDADTVADGACCGVGCYHGACWRAFDQQWLALRAAAPTVAVLLPYLEFGRDLPRFGEPGGWVTFAIRHLRERSTPPTPGASLVAVLQGYGDVASIARQRQLAADAGVTQTLVLRSALDETWRPVVRP